MFELSPRFFYVLIGAFSLIVPLYTWKRLYQQLCLLRETKLFHQRHNCCVTYFKGKGFAGWPPHKERLGYNIIESDQIYEPILYFLRTAKYSVNVAVMILNINVIEEVLCKIAKRGVLVRLVLDYDKCYFKSVNRLKQAGTNYTYCKSGTKKIVLS